MELRLSKEFPRCQASSTARTVIATILGEVPVRQLCALVVSAPGSYYYGAHSAPDLESRGQIEAIAAEFPGYGSRRTMAELGRQGHKIDDRPVLRPLAEANLPVEVERFCRTAQSSHSLSPYLNLTNGFVPEGPNRIWCADMT